MTPLDAFKLEMARIDKPQMLLCGAKPWPNSQDPDHRAHVPTGVWMTTDIEAGHGVDIVCDLQSLYRQDGTAYLNRFDGIFCPAVLEHINRPWCALYSMSRLLRVGGSLYIQTHQTFPLHGYPHDYFRFSREALELLSIDAGLDVVQSGYDGPCSIVPSGETTVWNVLAEAFLNVTICAKKNHPLPIG